MLQILYLVMILMSWIFIINVWYVNYCFTLKLRYIRCWINMHLHNRIPPKSKSNDVFEGHAELINILFSVNLLEISIWAYFTMFWKWQEYSKRRTDTDSFDTKPIYCLGCSIWGILHSWYKHWGSTHPSFLQPPELSTWPIKILTHMKI